MAQVHVLATLDTKADEMAALVRDFIKAQK
jgi:hypothetical protein